MFHQGDNGAHDYLLFNLADDMGEKHNLADEFPDKVKQLDALIEQHIVATNAVVPQPNPRFDPERYHPEEIGVPRIRNQQARPATQKVRPPSRVGGDGPGEARVD